MKNLIFLLMFLSVTINAQQVPNLTTEFSDIPEDILLWEMNEGDVALYKYSSFAVKESGVDSIQLMDGVMYVKLFFSEDRKKLFNIITVIPIEDELFQADYTIYSEKQNVVLEDGVIEFTGTNGNGYHSTIILLPLEGDYISFLFAVERNNVVYSTICLAKHLISKVWYEDVIKDSKQEDWILHYDFD